MSIINNTFCFEVKTSITKLSSFELKIEDLKRILGYIDKNIMLSYRKRYSFPFSLIFYIDIVRIPIEKLNKVKETIEEWEKL